MTTGLVIIGAGGFARETLDVVQAINAMTAIPEFRVLGFVDDAPTALALERMSARGYGHLGSIEGLARFEDCSYVVAIGDPGIRSRIASEIGTRLPAATLIHPAAGVGSASTVGAGSVICSGAQVSTNVRIGQHVHVNPNATVGHDAVLSDHVSVNPGAIVSGEVHVESGVLIGAGAVILQGLIVGSGTLVGASACVTRSSAPDSVLVGVPARAREAAR